MVKLAVLEANHMDSSEEVHHRYRTDKLIFIFNRNCPISKMLVYLGVLQDTHNTNTQRIARYIYKKVYSNLQ